MCSSFSSGPQFKSFPVQLDQERLHSGSMLKQISALAESIIPYVLRSPSWTEPPRAVLGLCPHGEPSAPPSTDGRARIGSLLPLPMGVEWICSLSHLSLGCGFFLPAPCSLLAYITGSDTKVPVSYTPWDSGNFRNVIEHSNEMRSQRFSSIS